MKMFVDKKLKPVDQQMVNRTADLLLNRRDGEGGFKKNPKAIDGFGRADDDITNAYIVYALTEAGYISVVKKELDAVYNNAKNGEDPYILALCANALFNTGDKVRGEEMITRLSSSFSNLRRETIAAT